MDKELRILILEDTPTDAELMENQLRREKIVFISKRVETKDSFLKELKDFDPDLILSDYKLPQFDGMTALKLTKELSPKTAFILVTGALDEETAVDCIKAGAADFVIKKHLVRLGPAINRALQLRQEKGKKEQAEKELRENLKKLRRVMGEVIHAIALTVEAKDPYTAGHQQRVADLARSIATEIGLEKERIEGIRMAGVLHDLGKISIPGEILNKPGLLNDLEYRMIKFHVQIGYDILKDLEFPWPIAKIMLAHHERMDGSGYPNGLKDEEILLEARILGVADVVEAMSSHRPYRGALGIDKALEEISKNKGILYDPEVANACLNLFLEKGYELEERKIITDKTL
ncbi:HD domain-containing protein [bacterium]|nr:HD domain-containing protein [bacterium]MBU1615740.1 HD domain-containing protein [bacterium]